MKDKLSEIEEEGSEDWQRPILGRLVIGFSAFIVSFVLNIMMDMFLGVPDNIRITSIAVILIITVILVHYALTKRGW